MSKGEIPEAIGICPACQSRRGTGIVYCRHNRCGAILLKYATTVYWTMYGPVERGLFEGAVVSLRSKGILAFPEEKEIPEKVMVH